LKAQAEYGNLIVLNNYSNMIGAKTMARYSSITPEGTTDLLFKECEARREVESKVINIFKGRGFSEVVTPSLEFYDVFSNQYNAIPQEMMYKLFDNKGRILVMRPDNTLPIARVAATRLKSFSPPLRLYYNQRIFRISPSMTGRSDEFTQCGIELIGISGKKADLEVIATAITSLKSTTQLDFCIEIGHVGFYKSIIDNLPFETQVVEQIRGFIEAKNYAALDDVLKPYVDTNPYCKALLALPKLFGGNEVFELALSIAPNEIAISTVNYLRDLYCELCNMGLQNYIMIDLGLVNQIHYYSGMVFRGFIQGSGGTVLSGGRYDELLSAFGADMPATGFAMNIDAVAKTLTIQSKKENEVLIYYDKPFAKAAFEHMETLTDAGIICEMSVFETLEQTKEYASLKGITQLDIVTENITSISL
jgi:ATP phosphoribosyltransferase regulatory subunit